MVVTFSGVPRVGGIVMGGRTAWMLVVKVSRTRLLSRLDLPTLSSPTRHTRTAHGVVSLQMSLVGLYGTAQTYL